MRLRTTALALLVLLPLGGGAGETAGPAVPPAPPALAALVTPMPPGPRTDTRQRAVPAPGAGVPTVRATLGPVAEEPPGPRRFRSGALDVDLPVVPVGVDRAGLMALPETVHEVGWYVHGARPGDRVGTAVLAAHVDTVRDGLGPFSRLRDLDVGDELSVDIAGGTRRYRVRSVELVAKSEVPLERVFRRDGPPLLRVITCGGSFSRRDGYRDNVIVTAVPG